MHYVKAMNIRVEAVTSKAVGMASIKRFTLVFGVLLPSTNGSVRFFLVVTDDKPYFPR